MTAILRGMREADLERLGQAPYAGCADGADGAALAVYPVMRCTRYAR